MYFSLIPDILSWLLPVLLASSLNSAYLLKGGFQTDEETAFKCCTAGILSHSPHRAVWKLRSTSLAMHSNEVVKDARVCACTCVFFPLPLSSFSQAPSSPCFPSYSFIPSLRVSVLQYTGLKHIPALPGFPLRMYCGFCLDCSIRNYR